MAESIPVAAQAVLTALPAAWLSLAARNNVVFAAHNRDGVNAVLGMTWLEEDAPADFAAFRHRRVRSTRTQARLFALLVVIEALIAVVLWAGAAALGAAATGWLAPESASALAVAGALAFTALWGAFLVGGEWFVYYATPRSPQNTHFLLLLWGLGTLAVLL